MLAVALLLLSSVSAPRAVTTEGDFADYLQPVLKSFGGIARVYYAGSCPSADSGLVFPTVKVEPPQQGLSGIDAVRQIFRDDPKVAVTQDRSGLLRIMVGNVSTAILQTTLPVLRLTSDDQYNEQLAIETIESAPEVQAAERSLNVYPPLCPCSTLYAVSTPKRGPHLPSTLLNATVDEVLDSVATTFKSIVSYGICTRSNTQSRYHLEFYNGLQLKTRYDGWPSASPQP